MLSINEKKPITSFYSKFFFVQDSLNKAIVATSLLISRVRVALNISVASITSTEMKTSMASMWDGSSKIHYFKSNSAILQN